MYMYNVYLDNSGYVPGGRKIQGGEEREGVCPVSLYTLRTGLVTSAYIVVTLQFDYSSHLLVILIAELQNINHTHYLYHSTKNRQFFDKYETLVCEKYKAPVDSKITFCCKYADSILLLNSPINGSYDYISKDTSDWSGHMTSNM